jgi:hypothetical protein
MPVALQKVDLLLTPDERRGRRPVQRLKPAFDSALTNYLIGMDRLWKAFHLDGAKIAVFEEIAEELPRLRSDHDRVGFAKSLQPSGEVRRLAHDAAFLPFAGGDQIANDDMPGANADANPQWLGLLELPDSVDERKTGSHCLLRIVLVRLRVAEIHQHAIAHVFGDKAAEMGDPIGNTPMIRSNDLTQVLGI